jgi:hypothetical protein
MKIKCSTLFDITKTGVNTRREFTSADLEKQHAHNRQRNQQINFETILQVINMRAQPENITDPVCQKDSITQFGDKYQKKRNKTENVWSFDFTVNHDSAFLIDENKLGTLIQDCNAVPMITELDNTVKLDTRLDTTLENCNIYFEISDETTTHL